MIETIFEKSLPFLAAFFSALAATLVLTPIVRETNRRLGMVDKPDPRRINKVPIPRGGGIALVLGVLGSYSALIAITGRPGLHASGIDSFLYWKYTLLATLIALLGLADDRWNLNAKLKLVVQLAIAFAAWWWCDIGFSRLIPALPVWADAVLTVFWIAGAVNAFNLIDGLDGLASGLALIATLGMAGSLFIVGAPGDALFYFAFAGGLVGFLRYNYNPASVFLGDTGSMFIGFTLAILPLVSQTQNSFLVSIGVPILAMGVPIFDTSLAILRRTIRGVIRRRDATETGNGKMMTADADHLHHRILRASGLNQRKAAWILYLTAMAAVGFGLVAMALKSKAGGLWLFAVALAAVVVFKDMARIELFDAGRLLNSVARDRGTRTRRRLAKLRTPFFLAADLAALIAAYFLAVWTLRMPLSRDILRVIFPLHIIAVFVFLALFNIYRTVWSRAMLSNYLRLFLACVFGAIAAGVITYYAPMRLGGHLKAFVLANALTSSTALILVRTARGIIRDLFYAIDCSRLKARKDVSRILVYGAGLRYRTFRRELVRTTAANDRMIVGLIDDDLLLRGQFIGGIEILGTLQQAPEIINAVNADTVVICCAISPDWLKIVKETLAPTGVKVRIFEIGEREV